MRCSRRKTRRGRLLASVSRTPEKIWIISCVIFLQLCILFYRRYDSTAGFSAVGERAASSEGVQEVGGKKDAVKNDERGAELGII